MATKRFKEELIEKTGHDLPWFMNACAGFKGGVTDVAGHLRDFESAENAAAAAPVRRDMDGTM